jgi:hypothetical protein
MKSRTGWIAVIAIGTCLGLCLFAAACVFLIFLPSSTKAATTYDVEYWIYAPGANASLTYNNAFGNTEQIDMAGDWKKTIKVRDGTFLYISAQLKNAGAIMCTISINGKPWRTSQSVGQFHIATCSGRAGDP